MSILEKLNSLLSYILPCETGVFSDAAPDRYLVITPLSEHFDFYTDDKPIAETAEVRLSIFDKGNYTSLKNQIVRVLLDEGFTVTDRRYIGFETDTGYHHYVIDLAKIYELED